MWKRLSVGRNKAIYDVIFDSYNDVYVFCDVLADYILIRYSESIIESIIKRDYDYLDYNELYKNINSALNDNSILEKQLLINKLVDYISQNDTLILDGFVMFRLIDYIKKLEAIADKTAREMIIQYEYDEFIDLLKFFVDIQSPMLEAVHIICTENKYIILDENFKEITNDYIDDFLHEMRYGKIDYDDLLLSALITIAPSEIYIYNTEEFANKELMRTLRKIFNTKIHFCDSFKNASVIPISTENIIKHTNIPENIHLS